MKIKQSRPLLGQTATARKELAMTETIAQKQKRGNRKLNDMLRYHKFTNLARCYADLMGKIAQRRESKRIKEKILFSESMGGKECQN